MVSRGARVLMLPMVATADEAARFAELVGGRARVVLLLERIEALEALDELVAVEGVDEIHIGLNDLALSLGLPSRWLVLGGEWPERAGEAARRVGMRFGLGGIGRAGDDDLPIPADLVYAEYARTGATSALISRSFLDGGGELSTDVRRARQALAAWRDRPAEDLAEAHAELAAIAGGSRVF